MWSSSVRSVMWRMYSLLIWDWKRVGAAEVVGDGGMVVVQGLVVSTVICSATQRA